MGFHDLLRRLAADPVPVDLSTGSPLVLPELAAALREGVSALAHDPLRDAVLSSYTELDGLAGVRDGIARLMGERFGRAVVRDEVIAVAGVQAALRYVLAWLGRHGRRALYPTGLEFPGAVDRAGGPPPAVGPHVLDDAGDGTWRPRLDVDGLEDWEGVGAVVLSRPHSPTGRDWTTEELTRLAARADARSCVLVLDETYAPPFAPIALEDRPSVDAPNVVHLFSMSKLGLAGERVGVVVGPPDLVAQLGHLQRLLMIQPPKVGQYLMVSLMRRLRADPRLRSTIAERYRHRWEAGWSAALEAGDDGVRVSRWEGGLFLWVEWDGGPTDVEVAEALLGDGIAVMPGSALWVAPDAAPVPVPRGLRIGLGADPDVVATATRAAVERVAAARPTLEVGS